jgi:competence protein ComEA
MKQSFETGRLTTLLLLLSLAFNFWLTGCSRSYSSANTPLNTAPTAQNRGSINLNTASAAELERLPGVGPMLAERIITYRETNGRFRRAEHLMMVQGISDRKFRALQSLVRVE